MFTWTRISQRLNRASTQWLDTTMQAARWVSERRASIRWAIAGGILGGLIGVLLFAPATWMASTVAAATGQRVLLVNARGTFWTGSAQTVLAAGPGSLDARMLPDRLHWSLRLQGLGLRLDLRQACCLNDTVSLHVLPGLGRVEARVMNKPDWIAQWPAALLSGLGTPWNTLDLGGAVRLSAQDLSLDWVQGRTRVRGLAELHLLNVSSRLTTLDHLGSYTVAIRGNPDKAGAAELTLATQEGALQLSGQGTVGPQGVYFRGEARSAEEQQTVLNNLLNIIGRREGMRSVISIG